MAVVKIWDVKNRLNRVIDYVADNEKTMNENYEEPQFDSLKDALEYTTDGLKTEDKYFVSGINCQPAFACEQMLETKRKYKKAYNSLLY